MVLAVLKVLKIGNSLRKNKEINSFLQLFKKYLTTDEQNLDISGLITEFNEISNNSDFSKLLFSIEAQKSNRNLAGIAFFQALRKNLPLKKLKSNDSEKYQLDSSLLSLLFKNSNKLIETKALHLILENFNHKINLFQELDEIHILYTKNQQQVYFAMKFCIFSLKSLFTRLINENDMASLIGEKMELGIEQSYIEGILFYFKHLKSLLNITQPKDHLLFAQGLARNLQFHRVLMDFFLNYGLPWLDKKGKRIIVSQS